MRLIPSRTLCLLRVALLPLALALFIAASTSRCASAQLDQLLQPVGPLDGSTKQPGIEESAGNKPKRADGVVLTEQELLRQLKAQLAEHFSLQGDLAIDLCLAWPAIQLPSPDASVLIVDYPRDGVASSFMVRIKIVSGEQTIGEWQIGLRAHLWQEVWIAEVRLDRGQALDKSVVGCEKIDVLLNHNAFLGAEVDLSDYEMDQTVNVGQPLKKRDVIEKPVIRKNQIVEAVANRGAIAISMKAQALENGTSKALIKMRNLDSRKEFTAQVVDESHVSVIF